MLLNVHFVEIVQVVIFIFSVCIQDFHDVALNFKFTAFVLMTIGVTVYSLSSFGIFPISCVIAFFHKELFDFDYFYYGAESGVAILGQSGAVPRVPELRGPRGSLKNFFL